MKNFGRKTQNLQHNVLLAFLAVGSFLVLPASTLAAPGDLDLTFGIGGKVTTAFNFGGANDIVLQADGKIVAVGWDSQFVLARYNTDGSLDVSFGNGGKVLTPIGQYSSAYAVGIQADGRIVVAGKAYSPSASDFAVVRYNTNGSLDTSFDGDGKVIVDMGSDDSARGLAIQPDGKIVVIGSSEVAGSRDDDFAVARLNSDGSLDASFGGNGKVITSLGGYSDYGASAVSLQTDGKIIVAGQRGVGPGFSATDFALVRYNAGGSLDNSFDNDGVVITSVGFFDNLTDIVLQPDGKIVAVGYISDFAAVIRYKDNGSLDTSFGDAGIVLTNIGNYDFFEGVALQSDGKIVAGGFNGEHVLARYNSIGSLDTSFGGDGLVTTGFDNMGYPAGLPYGGVRRVVVQPDGKIIGAGNWGLDGEFAVFALARYSGGPAVSNHNLFDFDGDGKSDISVFRPADQVWYLNQSQAGFAAVQFGLSTDKITPADYDGDGKTDISVFRDGVWYWLNSSNRTIGVVPFGTANDIPVPADYTGDGRAELAVYRGGVWWRLDLTDNQSSAIQFGLSTDKPLVADYDGDGRADHAVYRGGGEWHLNRSSQGYAVVNFGLATDTPVPADYDGDGRTDQAVYRNGTWYLLQSSQGFTAFPFGISTDIPAPADYDGDGRADAGVYRNGVWYLRQTTSGISIQQFGLTNDKPVPAAYLP